MDYQFPIQNQALNLKGDTNGLECRVERVWDTYLLVEIDGISNSHVKRVLATLHIARVACRKHVDHSEGESLSHSENVSQDHRLVIK
jgi:hypothetical protein